MENYKKRVPKEYYEKCSACGKIEAIEYDSLIYSKDRTPVKKKAMVYMPAGYDTNPNPDGYKTLYLMHGGGGDEREFLFGQDKKEALINIIDHMIMNGEIEPMVVVTPTFYYLESQITSHDIPEAALLTHHFPEEFRNDLLPLIEDKYNVKKGRENRAFGGFSMGSVTTWEILMNCLDLVEHIIPLSGDCWIVEEKGGASKPVETAVAMKEKLQAAGFENLNYNIFAATGDEDIAFPALDAQIKEMMKQGWGSAPNRLRYFSWAEGVHWYPFIYEYLYNLLPTLF